MMTHTAGPWSVRYCSHGGGLLRRGAQHGPGTHPQSSIQIIPIADAVLCSAAPDLLDVALRLIDVADGLRRADGAYLSPTHQVWQALIDQARLAVAKAISEPAGDDA